MSQALTAADLNRLVARVFRVTETDRNLALLVDLPDEVVPDNEDWRRRRQIAVAWCGLLREGLGDSGLERVDLVHYRNAHRNNAGFPANATVHRGDAQPNEASEIEGRQEPFDDLLARYSILIGMNELSATAPLKLAARTHGFRAASMPGFNEAMVPALKLDWVEIDRRCRALKSLLDQALAAEIRFRAGGAEHELRLDLRHRRATASGGLLARPGTAGNLPSGETYIVPYEDEIAGDPSRTAGSMPLELDGELMAYRIERNRVVEVVGDGPVAAEERREVEREPAYRNIAELGLGVLAAYGVKPIGELLLDEKLGLHIALGRSDHFGGQVGADDFTSPDRVVHIDRVYIPEVQPQVEVVAVDLRMPGPGSAALPLMREGDYVSERFTRE